MKAKMVLSLAYPPYPNDTYVFSAWSNGLVNAAPRVAVSLDHVEALNVAAFASRYTVTKASYGAMPLLLGDYRMLRAGSSFGLETGPLLVGRPDANGTIPTLESLPREARIAIRGPMTTCHLLLQLALGRSPIVEIMRPDRIIGAVARGEVAAGVLMAETCYPYEEAGLRCISDLGQWWRQETGRPTPVTGVLVRRDVPLDSAREIDATIRASLAFGREHEPEIAPYIQADPSEADEATRRNVISTYVNGFTEDVGDDGAAAVDELFSRALRQGLIPGATRADFV